MWKLTFGSQSGVRGEARSESREELRLFAREIWEILGWWSALYDADGREWELEDPR